MAPGIVTAESTPSPDAPVNGPFSLEKGFALSQRNTEGLVREDKEGRLGWRGLALGLEDKLKADFEGEEEAQVGNESYEPIFENERGELFAG